MVGSRHFEVAKMLKEIARGDQFSLRLVEPMKSGFSEFLQAVSRFVCNTCWLWVWAEFYIEV